MSSFEKGERNALLYGPVDTISKLTAGWRDGIMLGKLPVTRWGQVKIFQLWVGARFISQQQTSDSNSKFPLGDATPTQQGPMMQPRA